MHTNVKDHEPEMALFVPDHDPLLYYRRLSEVAKEILLPGGNIFVEIHEKYGREVCNLFENMGFTAIRLRKDISNKDRMVAASMEKEQTGQVG
jgi:release factor glutamine methyltransferase